VMRICLGTLSLFRLQLNLSGHRQKRCDHRIHNPVSLDHSSLFMSFMLCITNVWGALPSGILKRRLGTTASGSRWLSGPTYCLLTTMRIGDILASLKGIQRSWFASTQAGALLTLALGLLGYLPGTDWIEQTVQAAESAGLFMQQVELLHSPAHRFLPALCHDICQRCACLFLPFVRCVAASRRHTSPLHVRHQHR